MDASTLVWIIIGVVVVAIVIVVVVMLSRRNSSRHLQAQHDKAESMREEARRTEVAAREREAGAAQARADSAAAVAEAEQAKARAAQAGVEAERASAAIDGHTSDAARLREEQAEQLRKADDIDPAVTAAADDRSTRDAHDDADGRRIVRERHETGSTDRDAVRAHRDSAGDADTDVRSTPTDRS